MTDSRAESLKERFASFSTNTSTPPEAFALFEELRGVCPVPHSKELGGYFVALNYADAKCLHHDVATFSNEPSIMRPLNDRPQLPPLEFDGHLHKEWRKIFFEAVNPATPARIEDAVRADVNRLIDAFVERGSCDLMKELAESVPLHAICHVLGVDPDRGPHFRDLVIDVLAKVQDEQEGPQAVFALVMYGLELVKERREDPKDDYLTWIGQAEFDGRPIEDLEIGLAMFGLLMAGHDTSVSGLTSVLYEVLSRPSVRDQLIADSSLVPAAVDEALRLHPPFVGFFRQAKQDVVLGGTEIPAGSAVQACWWAANRDPQVFEDPHEFRLDRKPGSNRHLTFGFGPHACLGRPLAQMDLRVAVEELLRRLPDIALADPDGVEYEFLGMEAEAITTLPAVFTPGPKEA